MIRMSEAVLPGHPDKFCDQVADAIVAASMGADPDAYCQVEVAVWSGSLWLSGAIVSRDPLHADLEEIVRETGNAIGYNRLNHIDVARYQITNRVCLLRDTPHVLNERVNDQSIVVGYAGYGPHTAYLPPEHFLVHTFVAALFESCRNGVLRGHGPDGKVLVRLLENEGAWRLEYLLVTLQQQEDADFMDVCHGINTVCETTWRALQEACGLWAGAWDEVEFHINPNGPLIDAGSDGDNGQTGRKLVVDFYGPRVPIGGGALCGKDLRNIDRYAAYAARQAAVHAVRTGAREAMVTAAYAPNVGVPSQVTWRIDGRGSRDGERLLEHTGRIPAEWMVTPPGAQTGRGRHFINRELAWNGP